MALTDKQIKALLQLPAETKLEIMHICADDLALANVEEFCYATGENRRTVYQAIKDNKKLYFKICIGLSRLFHSKLSTV